MLLPNSWISSTVETTMSSGLTISSSSYDWALKHLVNEGDSDFFPKPFEIDAIEHGWGDIVEQLSTLDLSNYDWSVGRRFTVPKGRNSFRAATQLDPLDSLVLAAMIREHGDKIESRRRRLHERRVFSYRFDPKPDGLLYGETSLWHEFWRASLEKMESNDYEWVVIADITDYYNQIYHHVLGNQLSACGWPAGLPKVVEQKFLGTLTDGVSRSVPVGPHAVHLLAEAALIPIDDSLVSTGRDFCRFADDYHLFARSEEDAQVALFDFAEVIDKQQKLNVQNQKVKVIRYDEFKSIAESMLIDRPKNKKENKLLKILSKYSHGPYDTVSLAQLSPEELASVNSDALSGLLDLYFNRQSELYNETPPDYDRIGWLLRRLWQVGAPGVIDYIMEHLNDFLPVLGDTARYLVRSVPNYTGDIAGSADRIIDALDNPLIQRSEYVKMVLVNLFYSEPELNHVDKLTASYQSSPSSVKREILMAAGQADRGGWIRERKSDWEASDRWLRRAIIATLPYLPGDESIHWINRTKNKMNGLDKIVANWAFRTSARKPSMGSIVMA